MKIQIKCKDREEAEAVFNTLTEFGWRWKSGRTVFDSYYNWNYKPYYLSLRADEKTIARSSSPIWNHSDELSPEEFLKDPQLWLTLWELL